MTAAQELVRILAQLPPAALIALAEWVRETEAAATDAAQEPAESVPATGAALVDP